MPNGKDKQLNFTLKVWDAAAGAYRPVYIAPDATDKVQGDVKLSDATNSTANAASGMTAATPAAVKAVADAAGNKLDKLTSADQTVASKVTFNNSVIGNKGITVPSGQFFTGNLSGNATTATTLRTARTIALTGRVTGSASFNGGANASIATAIAAGSITGTDIATNTIALGNLANDVITQLNGKAPMSHTHDASNITSGTLSIARGGTGATDAAQARANIDAAATSHTHSFIDMIMGRPETANYASSGNRHVDVMLATNEMKEGYPGEDGYIISFNWDNNWWATQVFVPCETSLPLKYRVRKPSGNSFSWSKWSEIYSETNAHKASVGSAAKLATARTISLAGDVTGSANFDGSANISITSNIAAGTVGANELADNAVTAAKISTGAVTSAKIADGTIVAGDIADSTITGAKMVNSTITGAKIAASTITATNIANSTITNAKMAANSVNSSNIVDGSVRGTDIAADTITLGNLASDVGTIAVQSSTPTDSNVKIWVQI